MTRFEKTLMAIGLAIAGATATYYWGRDGVLKDLDYFRKAVGPAEPAVVGSTSFTSLPLTSHHNPQEWQDHGVLRKVGDNITIEWSVTFIPRWIGITASGDFAGKITVEARIKGAWIPIPLTNPETGTRGGGQISAHEEVARQAAWAPDTIANSGIAAARVRMIAYTSGSVNVWLMVSESGERELEPTKPREMEMVWDPRGAETYSGLDALFHSDIYKSNTNNCAINSGTGGTWTCYPHGGKLVPKGHKR